jgi:hypothetical protein
MKYKILVLLLGILFLAMTNHVQPVSAMGTDDYNAYLRLKTYSNVQACVLTDGIGNCLSPEQDSFDKIGVVHIEEIYTVWRVELYGSGAVKPVMLNVNGIWQDVSCFQDSLPNCWETMTFDIAPSKEVTIFSTEHTSVENHGFHLQWVKLWIYKTAIEATVDIDPNDLNLWSRGQFVTAYIELEGADVREINASTVLLNKAIPPILDESYGFVTSEDSYIVDHDGDGILERMLKFDRIAVEEVVGPGPDVSITISGQLNDGMRFEGTDTLRAFVPHSMLGVDVSKTATDPGYSEPERAETTITSVQRTVISVPRILQVF